MAGDFYQSDWLIIKTRTVPCSTVNAVTLWVFVSTCVRIFLNSASLHLVR